MSITAPAAPAAPASIVASYSTNEKTGQLRANLVPLLEAEVSAGYDALRIRTLEVAEESPSADVLDKAEALLAEARPACRKIALEALTEAVSVKGLQRAAVLRKAIQAHRVASSRPRTGKRNP